jgi:carboxyl-terminal processing protease
MNQRQRALLLAAALWLPLGAWAAWPPGVWHSIGYGEVIEVSDRHFRHFEVTTKSCIERPARDRAMLGQTLVRVVESEPDALTVRRGISRYRWRRLAHLPPACSPPIQRADARTMLDIVWTTFDEHYAFFAERDVDWEEQRRTVAPTLPSGADDIVLFDALSRLLAPLRDQHVRLRAGERLFVSGRAAVPVVEPDGLVSRHAQLTPALHRFLKGGSVVTELRSTANDQVWWGRVGPDVGYIALPSLWDFTAQADTDQDRESAAAEAAMDEVLTGLRPVRGVVLDLRVNSGGSDAVGLAIAGRFADRERLAFTKLAAEGRGRSAPYPVHLQPSQRERFDKPVVVLAGPLTASAAEVMLLGLRVLPRVTVLGRPTLGVFSDTLYRRLPNGWEFTLSNEIYRTPDGALFEGMGIPPQLVSAAPLPPRTLDDRFGVDIRAARNLILQQTK